MTNLEKQVWAAAFANEFQRERSFGYQHGKLIDDIHGFSCAEIADVTLEKFREAITGDDKEFLLPFSEGANKD